MKPSPLKFLPLVLILMASPVRAEEAQDHGHEVSAEHEHSHDSDHADQSHFNIVKPATPEAAWAMLEDATVSARAALGSGDNNALHETGEKLTAAVAALHDHPEAVEPARQEKLHSSLDQLSKAVDRLHHAAEDGDKAGAAEALDLIDSLRPLVKSLY